jgi:hypothetical protein
VRIIQEFRDLIGQGEIKLDSEPNGTEHPQGILPQTLCGAHTADQTLLDVLSPTEGVNDPSSSVQSDGVHGEVTTRQILFDGADLNGIRVTAIGVFTLRPAQSEVERLPCHVQSSERVGVLWCACPDGEVLRSLKEDFESALFEPLLHLVIGLCLHSEIPVLDFLREPTDDLTYGTTNKVGPDAADIQSLVVGRALVLQALDFNSEQGVERYVVVAEDDFLVVEFGVNFLILPSGFR